MRARVSTFVLGTTCLQSYDFGHKKRGNFKDNALTDEHGICPTRVIHALAGGAREREQSFGFSPRLLGQRALREG